MLPHNATLDKTNCLASLIGVRTSLTEFTGDRVPPFFIEDLEGFDLTRLAQLAVAVNPTGQDLAESVIASAAREMMGDIETLITNGYSLQNVLATQCSACTLTPVYTTNAGIVVKAAVPSSYRTLQITNLNILTNVDGVRNVVISDGVTPKSFSVTLQAGVIMPVKLFYETFQPAVRIYFEDPTVGVGRITCPVNSSCGCGSAQPSSTISVAGLMAGVETAVQYGFVPCASIGCSYDALVCSLIHHMPNIFGLALMYKVGEKLTIIKSQSHRQNETASFVDDGGGEVTKNYGQLYWAKMQGTAKMPGIKTKISGFLARQRGDRCIVCDSKFYTAGVTG